MPPVVSINRFATDTDAELQFLVAACRERLAVDAEIATHFAEGPRGSEAVARAVVALCDSGAADFHPLYPDNMPLVEKIRTIARKIYGAADIVIDSKVADDLKAYETMGFGSLPVCIAKTQYSFSTDPTLRGAPSGHMVPVREVRLSAGAGFVVAICGDIMTMPGLPREPAAEHINLDAHGLVQGLF